MMKILKYFKHSVNFYWHTGNKKIAVLGAVAGASINLITLLPVLGESAFIFIIAVFLADFFLIIISIVYFMFTPAILHNEIIDEYFVIFYICMIIALLFNRFITNFLAEKFFQYDLSTFKMEDNQGVILQKP